MPPWFGGRIGGSADGTGAVGVASVLLGSGGGGLNMGRPRGPGGRMPPGI